MLTWRPISNPTRQQPVLVGQGVVTLLHLAQHFPCYFPYPTVGLERGWKSPLARASLRFCDLWSNVQDLYHFLICGAGPLEMYSKLPQLHLSMPSTEQTSDSGWVTKRKFGFETSLVLIRFISEPCLVTNKVPLHHLDAFVS